ncbi:MAG: hypothetical protein E6G56_09775 [Actinobacteria bacterium]|nr:MAG: hypothetical protein E6G56_09775 [Actinomycetota bacterium]
MATGLEPTDRTPAESGEHERFLAAGAIAQQVSQVLGTLTMLAVVTVLGRTLSLPEFGTYGLLVSFTVYLLLVQGSVEGAAVRAIAMAGEQPERDRAFSSALVLYVGAGVLTGSVIAGGGWLVVGAIGLSHALQADAHRAVLVLGAVSLVGWPMKAFQDVLRGAHLFVEAAAAEVVGYLAFGAGTIVLVALDAPLWLLIGVGGTVPALIGLAAGAFVRLKRLPYGFRRRSVQASSLRELTGLSTYLFAGGASDLVIYALDRVILGALRSAASVGLYEGPVRAHNLIRQLQGTLVATVLPAASRYLAQGDARRFRDLLLRGTRYVLAATLPVSVILMVLAKPILKVWLGAKFGAAAVALTVLVGYWLVNVNMSVGSPMLIAAGHARWLARYAWLVAALNLALSLLLTWWLGLNGVVLGTTVAYLVLFPVYLAKLVSTLPASPRALARAAWIPTYSTAAALAAILVAVRLLVPLHTVAAVLAVGLGGLLVYWGSFYVVWLAPGERLLVRDTARAAARRLTQLGRQAAARPNDSPSRLG